MNISKAKVIDLLDKAGKEFDKTQFVFDDSCDDKYAQVWITPLKDWTSRWQNLGLCLPEGFQTVSNEYFKTLFRLIHLRILVEDLRTSQVPHACESFCLALVLEWRN